MPPVEMTHEQFGTRTVKDEQVQSYENHGWSRGAEVAPPVVDASVQEVLDSVGDNPAAAREALEAEQSRPSPRKTLVTALVRLIDDPDPEA